MQNMSRQPDGWDLVKAICAIGTIAGILSWLSGERDGGPFAIASMVSGSLCYALEPPICSSCEVRTAPAASGFRCPCCLRLVPKFA
jgi:hypothetical protein